MDVKTIKGISCIFFLFIMLILCSSPYSVAADAATVYERFSRYFDKLPPGPNVVFIDVEKISFVRLDLETRDVAYNVRVYLSTFSYNPASLPLIDDAYQYHNLLITNLDSSNLISASVEFRIPKDWISSHSVDLDHVAVYRLVDNRWEQKPSEKIAEDIGYVYYKAVVDGFSYFVITAPAIGSSSATQVSVSTEPSSSSQDPVSTASGQGAVSSDAASMPSLPGSVAPDDASGPQSSLFSFRNILLIFSLIAILLGAFFAFTRKSDQKRFGVDDLLIIDVSPHDFLRFADGTIVKNLYDLRDALSNMDDQTFKTHVNASKNDISSWASAKLHELPLGLSLKLNPGKDSMFHTVQDKITELENKQLCVLVFRKHGLFPEKTREMIDMVARFRREGFKDGEIVRKLLGLKYPRDVISDVVYGMFEDIEDIIIHPEDQARLEQYIFEAVRNKHDFLETKQGLLDMGWPRFIVEKKMHEHFKSRA